MRLFGQDPTSKVNGPKSILDLGPGALGQLLWTYSVFFAAAACFLASFFAFFLPSTGVGPGKTVAVPPAFSIFSLAVALKRWAETLSFLVSSPSPRTFSRSN